MVADRKSKIKNSQTEYSVWEFLDILMKNTLNGEGFVLQIKVLFRILGQKIKLIKILTLKINNT